MKWFFLSLEVKFFTSRTGCTPNIQIQFPMSKRWHGLAIFHLHELHKQFNPKNDPYSIREQPIEQACRWKSENLRILGLFLPESFHYIVDPTTFYLKEVNFPAMIFYSRLGQNKRLSMSLMDRLLAESGEGGYAGEWTEPGGLFLLCLPLIGQLHFLFKLPLVLPENRFI